jgi:hypothetical protein
MKDPIADANLQQLNAYSRQFLPAGLPEFVKSAERDSVQVPPGSPLSAYADPLTRSFPCHTKVATYLSNLYLAAGQANKAGWSSAYPFEKVAERIAEAARFWGITNEIESVQKAVLEKSAAPQLSDSDFALVTKYGNEDVRRFPVNNPESIKESAARLFEDRINYPYSWRQAASRSILVKAAEHKVDLPQDTLDYLYKAAGVIFRDTTDIAKDLVRRALAADKDGARPAMYKLANRVGTVDLPIEKMAEVCNLIDTFDRNFGILPLYRSGMPLPEEVCFEAPTAFTKKADAASVTLTTGNSWDLAAIKSAGIKPFTVLDSETLQEIVPNDISLDIDKVAEILPTLPLDSATTLEASLRAVGCSPLEGIAKESARRNGNEDFSLEGLVDFAKKAGRKINMMNFAVAIPMLDRAGNEAHAKR